MKTFTFLIIIFSISGTFWSMWLRNEIKNEEAKLKEIENEINSLETKIELAEVEWSYITRAKNIELFNNKFLKLEPIPIVDSKSYFRKDLLISKIEK
tara:strand:+ start:188 stop:478 length:291 start_codon:yes stop_codon:yes gene_type:complete